MAETIHGYLGAAPHPISLLSKEALERLFHRLRDYPSKGDGF